MVDLTAMPVRGIIFDKDGTLFDFRATWAGWAQRLLTRLGAGQPGLAARLGQAIGFDHDTAGFSPHSPVIAGTPRDVATLMLPLLPGHSAAELVGLMNDLAGEIEPAAAVPLAPLLQALRAEGIRIGLATNDADAPARAHLDRAGISDQFDFIAGWDSGFGAKPGAGQLLAFCASTGLQPAEVLMVGDSTHDLHAARAAGMGAVAVLTGIAGAADLAPHADVVLRDIGELPRFIAARDQTGL